MDKNAFLAAKKLFNFIDDTEIKIAEFKSFLQYAGNTCQFALDSGGYAVRCVLDKSQVAVFVNGLVADLERAVASAKADLAGL